MPMALKLRPQHSGMIEILRDSLSRGLHASGMSISDAGWLVDDAGKGCDWLFCQPAQTLD